jgi:hypothetical protein
MRFMLWKIWAKVRHEILPQKAFVALLCLVQIGRPLLTMLLALGLKAQVSVQFTAQAGQRMLVGVNGFLQHSQPSHSVLIQGLDTGINRIEVLLLADSTAFFRTLRLPSGTHYYQLVQEGTQRRWRYAEMGPKPDREVVFHQKLAWHPGPLPPTGPAVVPTNPAPQEWPPAPVAIESSTKTSVVEAVNPPAAAQTPSARPPLPTFQPSEYEFERLQKSLTYGRDNGFTHQDLQLLVSQFRYENSKLDFLIRAYPLAKEPARFPELASLLEFPASRERLASETWNK